MKPAYNLCETAISSSYQELLLCKEKTMQNDLVNHPAHYKTKNGLETIDVIEAFTDGMNGLEATHTGNVLKYMCRWKKKNGLTDLKKAQWYLNRLIEWVEKEDAKALNSAGVSGILATDTADRNNIKWGVLK